MSLPVRTKQPGVKRKATFDFSAECDGGDTVTAITAIVAEPGVTVDLPGTLTTPLVTVLVSGGLLGTTYKVTCEVDTAQGQHLERDVLIRVVEEN